MLNTLAGTLLSHNVSDFDVFFAMMCHNFASQYNFSASF